MNIVIITGLSGSGKSTAIKALEDVGYFCVDNLPVALLPKFLEFQVESRSEISKIALVMDLREEAFLVEYKDVLSRLRSQGYEFDIIFLEASDEALLRRYSQTRRQHPIATGGKTLLEGIRAEKGALDELKEIANKVIDTSTYNVHALKDVIVNHVLKSGATGTMHAQVLSFGYKYGIPYDADLVFDVRFLPNPYFIPDLKELNGEDPAVRSYVLQLDETTIFLKKMFDLFDYLVPLYEKEGKSYLTIAFGCTGGKHRSVTISAEIYKHLEQKINYISLKHRDIELG
ncbi:MAG: RNase adapter RapZ [Pseudomonadota bacterium]